MGQKMPTTIGDLIHLRYIYVSCNYTGRRISGVILSLKSLYKLYHLQVINVKTDSSCNIDKSEMEGICNLINLRYCIFWGFNLWQISGLGKLSSLQELKNFWASDWSGSIILGRLKHLTGLQKLGVYGLSDVRSPDVVAEAEINKKEYLKSLKLTWSDDRSKVRDREEDVADNLKPPTNLNELSISNYAGIRSPCWMNDSSCCNLTYVKLSSCYRWEHLPPLGQLNSLKSLKLSNMYAVKQVGYSLYGNSNGCVFPSLRQLQFEDMPEWEEWIGVEDKTFPCLENLVIEKCPKLKRFPSGSCFFPVLRQLGLNEMQEWTEWIGPENELLFPCLDELIIRKCPKLKRFPTLPASLRFLEITDTALDALPLFHQNTVGTSAITQGFSLFELEISCCPNIVTLVGCQLLQQPEDFRALKILSIKECRNLLHMPMGFLRKLQSSTGIAIMDCPKLIACEMQLPAMFKWLEFGSCGDLEPLFIRSLYDLTSLASLHIHGCASLQSLPQVFARMPFLYSLKITSCKELTSLNGIEVLTKLETLYILGCEKLTELSLQQPPLLSHDNTLDSTRQHLNINALKIDRTSLLLMEPLRSCRFIKYLEIDGDSQVISLHEQWLLQNRLSLGWLTMHKAASLQSLPSCMENMYTLEFVEIGGCKMLKSLPNLPLSLKHLFIDECHSELADPSSIYWSRTSHIPHVHISTNPCLSLSNIRFRT
ncbi:hypothetical protein LUZ60_014848 [Juncus effusus]|nr:hypothetical protein LUZ60_014848 [Juncus effusus]